MDVSRPPEYASTTFLIAPDFACACAAISSVPARRWITLSRRTIGKSRAPTSEVIGGGVIRPIAGLSAGSPERSVGGGQSVGCFPHLNQKPDVGSTVGHLCRVLSLRSRFAQETRRSNVWRADASATAGFATIPQLHLDFARFFRVNLVTVALDGIRATSGCCHYGPLGCRVLRTSFGRLAWQIFGRI
jgi:hypothetical protein